MSGCSTHLVRVAGSSCCMGVLILIGGERSVEAVTLAPIGCEFRKHSELRKNKSWTNVSLYLETNKIKGMGQAAIK